jgi:hypothetical protein
MSDDKAQMSNQIQRSVKICQNLNFDIHLTFACLREAPPPEALRRAGASAKAGILAFAIAFIKVVVCLFGQLVETIF